MSKRQTYFDIGNKLFWALILLILVFAILKLNPNIFKTDYVIREIIVEDSLSKIDWEEKSLIDDSSLITKDSVANDDNELIARTWKWKSYDGRTYELNFEIRKSDYQSAIRCRENSVSGYDIWSVMYQHDKLGLIEMVEGYRQLINKNNLNGMDALNMVVSSVQSIPYVLISNESCPNEAFDMQFTNDCRPRSGSPSGCCGFILPWGVYSPIEYAVNGAGDCDTKSLFAFTILKELDLGYYEVAMLTGDVDAGAHAMLGVNILNPPYNQIFVKDIWSNKFYAWETTSTGNELGQNVWRTWNNWRVINL